MSGSSGHFLLSLTLNNRKISLIGMSGLGKSHWSRILEQHGFERYSCDSMIAARLLDRCEHPEGKIGCLGQWMGLPFEPGYAQKASQYLSAETDALKEVIAALESADPDQKMVIDTTGSAPYTGEQIMERLRELTLMVHLAVSESVMVRMLTRYIQSPRPVLWGEHFSQRYSETAHEALARSYRDLLLHREVLYRKYAHISIPYDSHRTDDDE